MPPHSGGGASAPSAHAETLREAFGAVTPLRRSAPAPLKGSLFSRDAPLSLPSRGGPQGSAASGGRSDRSGWAATCLGGPQRGPGRLSGNPGARRSRDGEVCRPKGGGASAPSAHAGTLRETFGAVTPLRRSAPAPLKGSLFLRRPALCGVARLSAYLRRMGMPQKTRSTRAAWAARSQRRRPVRSRQARSS